MFRTFYPTTEKVVSRIGEKNGVSTQTKTPVSLFEPELIDRLAKEFSAGVPSGLLSTAEIQGEPSPFASWKVFLCVISNLYVVRSFDALQKVPRESGGKRGRIG